MEKMRCKIVITRATKNNPSDYIINHKTAHLHLYSGNELELKASTDKTLGVLIIPSSVVEKYIESNYPLNEVLLTGVENGFASISFFKTKWDVEELKKELLDALELGMQIRQDQLGGFEHRSGKDVFEEWFNKRYY